MTLEPGRPSEPAHGYHRIASERHFRYLELEQGAFTTKWTAVDAGCQFCGTDTGLVLILDETLHSHVLVLCPLGCDPLADLRIDRQHFITYSRLRGYADPNPDLLWIIDAGFGEEPPPPPDIAHDLIAGWGYAAKKGGNAVKAEVKGAIRSRRRAAAKAARNAAYAPVAAVLRAAWGWQAGPTLTPPPRPRTAPKPPKTPPVSAYRKALGIDAPKRGPKCLVCQDTGRITAPGISIPCTECAGPAAAATAAAEKRAERARQGKDRRTRPSPATTTGPGLVNTGTVNGSVQVAGNGAYTVQISGNQAAIDGQPVSLNDPRVKKAKADAAKAVRDGAKAVRANGGHSGVTINGRRAPEGHSTDANGNSIYVNTGVVNTSHISDDAQDFTSTTSPKPTA